MNNEDPRFPNRKKRNWDQSALDGNPAETDTLVPGAEFIDVEHLPFSSYRVIGEEPKTHVPDLVELEAPIAIYASAASPAQDTAAAPAQNTAAAPAQDTAAALPASTPPTSAPLAGESLTERLRRFAKNPTRLIATIAAVFGVLLAVVLVALLLFTSKPEGHYDLGSAASSAAGLQGRLYLQWEKTLRYRLSLEASDPAQRAGFALAVVAPPRPLSVQIHLQNAQGFVLCSREIVLKYVPHEDADTSPAQTGDQPGKELVNRLWKSQADEQANAQEAEREQGKDLFQNQTGADGQVASLYAQGEIPCSQDAYQKAVAWSFTSNFPAPAEQDELLKRQQEERKPLDPHAAQTLAVRQRRAAKAAAKLLPFSIEGDDAIVDFDIAQGVIATRGGRSFFIDEGPATAADSRWQDYPVNIHYRCERNTSCELMHSGLGGLRVRLKR
jgi:hypothetical protein